MRTSISIVLVAFAAVGCSPSPRQSGGDDDTSPDASNVDNDGNNQCAHGTELVYVIDQFANRISEFDPATKTFTDLGSLSCPTQLDATPFSMSVDRNAVAWVLYDSGELFNVTLSGLACTRTGWASPDGLFVFGMGFSSDVANGSTESLYLGGGASQVEDSFTLARVDTATMTTTVIGTEPQLPEMTGTGSAELWGFFPDETAPQVVKFDKTNGSIAKSFPEPTLAGTMSGYAFAQWGGDYWVFLIRNGEPSTNVYQVDGMTGAIKSTTPTVGRTIVGAGVSTCAPVVIP